jgi:hypothetical protein
MIPDFAQIQAKQYDKKLSIDPYFSIVMANLWQFGKNSAQLSSHFSAAVILVIGLDTIVPASARLSRLVLPVYCFQMYRVG